MAKTTSFPSRLGSAVFSFKRLALCVAHLSKPRVPVHSKVAPKNETTIAESRTALFRAEDIREKALELGKVQNLRVACRALDGILIPAGEVFSFWSQVGRCTRGKGYVEGRELREGCLVPAIGGGLCQLSNALYDLALRSGCEIVQRHAHTSAVPGSAAEEGRDATVAWNYIDLRFMPATDTRIEATLTADQLVVRFKGVAGGESLPGRQVKPLRVANSCASCGETGCHRHEKAAPTLGKTAYLVDELWPEFDRYLGAAQSELDCLMIPLDGHRFGKPQYAWTTKGFAELRAATVPTITRSIRTRRLAQQGALRQRAMLRGAEELADWYGRRIPVEATHLVVSLGLLPFLWREGHLGGRTFDVLITRHPIAALQALLDEAFGRDPSRVLLADFRAPKELIRLESEALARASRLITPHRNIALNDPRKLLLDWVKPPATMPVKGSAIAFPGPTISRKGAYEVREAARMLNLEVVAMGSQLEGPGFWEGVKTRPPHSNWLDGVAAVVQPAILEDKPRKLLQALAAGVPVICTEACGISGMAGVTTVPPNDVEALAVAIHVTESGG